MADIIGLDIGDKRVGVALGSREAGLASPYGVFPRADNRAEREIIKLAGELGCRLVVAGLPLDENGRRTPQCEGVERFCRRLVRRLDLKLVFVDEYLSSCEAGLLTEHRGPRRRRGSGNRAKTLDAEAAAVILQSFLDEEGRKVAR